MNDGVRQSEIGGEAEVKGVSVLVPGNCVEIEEKMLEGEFDKCSKETLLNGSAIKGVSSQKVDVDKELKKKVAKGRFMLNEMVGVIKLKKYRTMRRQYGSKPQDDPVEGEVNRLGKVGGG